HDEIVRIVEFQEEIVEKAGIEKRDIQLLEVDSDIKQAVVTEAKDKLDAAIQIFDKHEREDAIESVKEEIKAKYEEDEDKLSHVKMALDELIKNEVRRLITEEKV